MVRDESLSRNDAPVERVASANSDGGVVNGFATDFRAAVVVEGDLTTSDLFADKVFDDFVVVDVGVGEVVVVVVVLPVLLTEVNAVRTGVVIVRMRKTLRNIFSVFFLRFAKNTICH